MANDLKRVGELLAAARQRVADLEATQRILEELHGAPAAPAAAAKEEDYPFVTIRKTISGQLPEPEKKRPLQTRPITQPQVLDAVRSAHKAVTAAEVGAIIGSIKTSEDRHGIHRALNALKTKGCVIHDPETGLYTFGKDYPAHLLVRKQPKPAPKRRGREPSADYDRVIAQIMPELESGPKKPLEIVRAVVDPNDGRQVKMVHNILRKLTLDHRVTREDGGLYALAR